MRHQTRLCIAGALLFIATDCTQRKNPQFQCICTVGSDTLTLHRAEQLVPDSSSAPAHARILRALFECMYAGRIRASASTGTGAQDKQLALDLAQQLSRQNNDAWTPEAAMVLYDAAKYLKSKAAEGQSMLNMLACSESLFTGTVVFCDTGSKGIIISGKDSLFNVWSTQQTTHSMAELLSALLIVPAPTARIVCDFLNSAETSPNTGSDARTMIKGLLFDSSRIGKRRHVVRLCRSSKTIPGRFLGIARNNRSRIPSRCMSRFLNRFTKSTSRCTRPWRAPSG